MNPSLRSRLLSLAQAECRLAALGGEAEPRLAELREANARQLELYMDDEGWPVVDEVGVDGTEAALIVALAATSRPAFMRRCLTLMMGAAARGELPAEQPALLEGRLLALETSEPGIKAR